MNGIEKITQRIQSDAQAEINGILGDANDEVERIQARFEAQAAAVEAELNAKNEKAAQQQEERIISAAQMEARKVQLAAKQEMVEQVYARALEKLCSMPEEQYVSVLAELLMKASSTGTESVVFSEKDQKAGKAAVEKVNAAGKKLTVAAETAPMQGGFLLRGERIEVNCSFETLVRLQKMETAGTVAKMLFPET